MTRDIYLTTATIVKIEYDLHVSDMTSLNFNK